MQYYTPIICLCTDSKRRTYNGYYWTHDTFCTWSINYDTRAEINTETRRATRGICFRGTAGTRVGIYNNIINNMRYARRRWAAFTVLIDRLCATIKHCDAFYKKLFFFFCFLFLNNIIIRIQRSARFHEQTCILAVI